MSDAQDGGVPPQDALSVLHFWFEELDPSNWFAQNDSVDARIHERFGDLHKYLANEVPREWRASPRGVLAAVIVLDQFSRNLFRDDGRAFANDSNALHLAKSAIKQGQDSSLSDREKPFLYMPLMHSEDLADVDQCTKLMEIAGAQDNADFSRRHAAALQRFGRYPARNKALGRENTPEESAFLKENPHGF